MKDNNDVNDTSVSLKEYIESRLEALENATTIAAGQMERRLEGMNEFRQQLRDQNSTFVTRNEHDSLIKKFDEDITLLRNQQADYVGKTDVNKINDDIRTLREAKAQLEGKASQQSVNVTMIVAILGVFLWAMTVFQGCKNNQFVYPQPTTSYQYPALSVTPTK